jgi:hypothetical protein
MHKKRDDKAVQGAQRLVLLGFVMCGLIKMYVHHLCLHELLFYLALFL